MLTSVLSVTELPQARPPGKKVGIGSVLPPTTQTLADGSMFPNKGGGGGGGGGETRRQTRRGQLYINPVDQCSELAV